MSLGLRPGLLFVGGAGWGNTSISMGEFFDLTAGGCDIGGIIPIGVEDIVPTLTPNPGVPGEGREGIGGGGIT